MAMWPWIGRLVDGGSYGDSAEFLQVQDRWWFLGALWLDLHPMVASLHAVMWLFALESPKEYRHVRAWSKRIGERPAVCLGILYKDL